MEKTIATFPFYLAKIGERDYISTDQEKLDAFILYHDPGAFIFSFATGYHSSRPCPGVERAPSWFTSELQTN